MATKPTKELDWVTSGDPTRIIEPITPLKNQGYSPGARPASQNHNWIFYISDQWIKYLEEITDDFQSTSTGNFGAKLIGYDPVDDSDWDSVPSDVKAALDEVADRVNTNENDISSNDSDISSLQSDKKDIAHTGNTSQTGNDNQTGDKSITGALSITGEAVVDNIKIDNNTIENESDDLIVKSANNVVRPNSDNSVDSGSSSYTYRKGYINQMHVGIAEKSSDYVIADNDGIDTIFGSGESTFTLPNPSNNLGRKITIKKTDSNNNIIIARNNDADSIDGNDRDYMLYNQYQSITVIAASANTWYIV